MSDQSDNKPKWEAWQLSALVLGELDPPTAKELKRAASKDPELYAEIRALKKTMSRVQSVYKSELGVSLDSRERSQRLQQIFAIAAGAESDLGDSEQRETEPASLVEPASMSTEDSVRKIRMQWLGLVAMSVCLFLAVYLAIPRDTAELANGPSDSDPLADSRSNAEDNNPVGQVDGGEAEDSQINGRQANDRKMAASEENGLTGNDNAVQALAGVAGETSSDDQFDAPASQELTVPNLAVTDASGEATAEAPTAEQLVDAVSEGGKKAASTGDIASIDSATGAAATPNTEVVLPASPETVSPPTTHFAQEQILSQPADTPPIPNAGYGGSGLGMGGLGGRRPEVDGPGVLNEAEKGQLQRPFGDVASSDKFQLVDDEQLSTFPIDVDSGSFAGSRQMLLENQRLPLADSVRIEDFVNYFDYDYTESKAGSEKPFGVNLDVTACPWKKNHKLVRIGLQAEEPDAGDRPRANFVFLIDVSGSMNSENKLPLVQESMRMLIRQLNENDRIAMVVYSGAAGCVLESTPGNMQATLIQALENLKAGGSTNGGDGIQLAYDIARKNFIKTGVNRVILCTDGDFNVGVTDTASLVGLIEENANKHDVFLTVLGFGMGDTNDAMMEEISNRGNGVYGFIDNRREAYRQMVEQLTGNLVTVAKDVKIQVEFNPNRVKAYRLLGYENRMLSAENFSDDTKDAGEIGSGHRVTALYEIVPVGAQSDALAPKVSTLRYRKPTASVAVDELQGVQAEWLAVKLRYKQPDSAFSQESVYPLSASASEFEDADRDTRWAATMAEFAMQLRESRYLGTSNWLDVLERAKSAAGPSPDPERQECLEMIRRAARLNRR